MMKQAIFLLPLLGCLSSAAPNCPPLGPVFPKPPSDILSSSPAIISALSNLTSTFTARDLDNNTGAYSTSYSIEVWSATDPSGTPLWSWHHTAPNLTRSVGNGTYTNTTGVRRVDKNTVYRLGSLTKIFTIYTWLVQDGDVKWNTPITEYVPELQAVADRSSQDAVANVDWGDVTIGALASQMAGIVRDCKSPLQRG